jgi:small subunit ribosomal protein S14
MKYLVIKDKNIRNSIKKNELKKLVLKSLLNNLNINKKMRAYFFIKVKKIPKKSNKIRAVNRCLFTNRAHSVFKKFKISRLFFKKLVCQGDLVGIYRKTW